MERRFMARRYRFASGALVGEDRLSASAHAALMQRQAEQPVAVLQDDRKTWWLFRERIYWEDEGLSEIDVKALALQREERRVRQLERAHDRMLQRPGNRREAISEDLRRVIFRRDGGACVRCGSPELLQFDHVIPVSRGGATTSDNLQILCIVCNREKGADL